MTDYTHDSFTSKKLPLDGQCTMEDANKGIGVGYNVEVYGRH